MHVRQDLIEERRWKTINIKLMLFHKLSKLLQPLRRPHGLHFDRILCSSREGGAPDQSEGKSDQ